MCFVVVCGFVMALLWDYWCCEGDYYVWEGIVLRVAGFMILAIIFRSKHEG